eukprot:CAMPEP_0195526964 /NCGR_PEP_ID=MMETSP0794_2-20130614/28324_1 /TAXON_ID=515487 /ORGANISM="Stephanopyxis turris, Strain CCMP 815" /LENGTH=366 /DNA_ID=CAMNT_0040657765 /DNA_START=82 /DNA_END=1182 /DNA_ORIENTATION=-
MTVQKSDALQHSAKGVGHASGHLFRRWNTHNHYQTTKALATTVKNGSETKNKMFRRARRGDVVTIEFELQGEGDYVPEPLFDSSGVISFVLGWGNYLPGIHELIEGMKTGDSVSNVSIDAGWGEKNPNLITTISKESSAVDLKRLKVGSDVYLQSGHKCTIVDISDDDFTIDCNPPLAGACYSCNLKLLEFEQVPDTSGVTGESNYEVLVFGLGCFWGGELAFMREHGVVGTRVGFSQGHVDNPSYEDVCEGSTGHTEVIQVVYDPDVVSIERLVRVGMGRLGDSVYMINQVGNDSGTQYRHGIYYYSEEQRVLIEDILKEFGEECQTELEQAETFWPAEEYHQQYLLKGGQSAKKGVLEKIRCYG